MGWVLVIFDALGFLAACGGKDHPPFIDPGAGVTRPAGGAGGGRNETGDASPIDGGSGTSTRGGASGLQGRPDAGGAAPAAGACDRVDANGVHLYGFFSRPKDSTPAYYQAVAPNLDGQIPCVNSTEGFFPTVDPTTQNTIYVWDNPDFNATRRRSLKILREDPLEWKADGSSPAAWTVKFDGYANDDEVPTPACDTGKFAVSTFYVNPRDGHVIYNCNDVVYDDGSSRCTGGSIQASSLVTRACIAGPYFDGTTKVSDNVVLGVAYDGRLVIASESTYGLAYEDPATHDVVHFGGSLDFRLGDFFLTGRAAPDKLWLATFKFDEKAIHRYSVDPAGNVTDDGSYGEEPDGDNRVGYGAAINGTGDLFLSVQLAGGSAAMDRFGVYRMQIEKAKELVYDDMGPPKLGWMADPNRRGLLIVSAQQGTVFSASPLRVGL